jgi:dienelactone hydrolase
MKNIFRKIVRWFKHFIKKLHPSENAVKGSSIGLLTVTGIFWIVFAIGIYKGLGDEWVLLFLSVFIVAAVLFGFLARWLLKQLSSLSEFFKLALLIAVPLLFIMSFDWIVPLIFIALSMICGATILVLKKSGFKSLSKLNKAITALGLLISFGGFVLIGILYAKKGFELNPIANAALNTETEIPHIEAISPAQKGSYAVKILTYGSGKDRHRAEFGEGADIKTDSVNGLAFIDDWDGFGGWYRTKYWGFDSKSLPLNARVWYPEGEGPFPLALIVHGNHGMQDYSDTGYAYLGELLASRGIILASVDENFINGSWSDIFGGLDEENDARGWLLLEHLKVWHQWNKTEDHLFYNKIDTDNLALIGHSRGGEAVAHAAMFNQLPYYPDDASVKFDYNYHIKSIVAIAPVDGQYEPGESRSRIEDVNYFVLHGAQDGDVTSYMGSQQYERVSFKDSLYHFKSGVYIYGANHGQFNTSWGENDTGNPFTGLLNLKQLLSGEDQRKIAEVYISAFLDISLKNKKEYLPLFLDARRGKEWLPKTIYLNQFEDSNLKTVANFDEDFNAASITEEGGEVHTKNLTVWREQEIKLKWQKKGSRAVVVGWHYKLEDERDSISSVPDSLIASYAVRLPDMSLDSTTVLVFSMAESRESADPKSKGKWVKNKDESKENNGDSNLENDENETVGEMDEQGEEADEEEEEEKPIDFTIQLIDSTGQTASFPLSRFSPLQREIEVLITKVDFLTDDKQSEKVFQTFYFPAEDFRGLNSEFNISGLEEIRFVFDQTESGVITIDNIGFMKRFD